MTPAGRGDAPRHVVLVGLAGAGKTTTGAALAARLDRPLRDNDADVEGRAGRTGAQLAAVEGVDALHRLEEEVLLAALAADTPAVITAAGSTVASTRCREALRRRALVAWLDLPAEHLSGRVTTGTHRRPLEPVTLSALATQRRGWFEEVADLHLDASRPTDELVEAVVRALR